MPDFADLNPRALHRHAAPDAYRPDLWLITTAATSRGFHVAVAAVFAFFFVFESGIAYAGDIPTNYTFTNIADTNGAFSDFTASSFTINASGVVAFSAPLKAGGRGIYVSGGGTPSKIVEVGDTLEVCIPPQSCPQKATNLGNTAFIGNTGAVAFSAYFSPTEEAVFTGDGTTPKLRARQWCSNLTPPAILVSSMIL